MDDFINVIKEDLQIQDKTKDMLDRNLSLSSNYRSRIGYDTLIQNNILKELIKVRGTTTTDLDIELKIKISRIKYLESRLYDNLFQRNWIF